MGIVNNVEPDQTQNAMSLALSVLQRDPRMAALLGHPAVKDLLKKVMEVSTEDKMMKIKSVMKLVSMLKDMAPGVGGASGSASGGDQSSIPKVYSDRLCSPEAIESAYENCGLFMDGRMPNLAKMCSSSCKASAFCYVGASHIAQRDRLVEAKARLCVAPPTTTTTTTTTTTAMAAAMDAPTGATGGETGPEAATGVELGESRIFDLNKDGTGPTGATGPKDELKPTDPTSVTKTGGTGAADGESAEPAASGATGTSAGSTATASSGPSQQKVATSVSQKAPEIDEALPPADAPCLKPEYAAENYDSCCANGNHKKRGHNDVCRLVGPLVKMDAGSRKTDATTRKGLLSLAKNEAVKKALLGMGNNNVNVAQIMSKHLDDAVKGINTSIDKVERGRVDKLTTKEVEEVKKEVKAAEKEEKEEKETGEKFAVEFPVKQGAVATNA